LISIVEDGLLVVRREPPPRSPPLPQHLHGPVRRLDVVEAGVGPVVVKAVGVVARRRHVREHADVPERVALAHTTRRPHPACRETISAGRAAMMHLQVII